MDLPVDKAMNDAPVDPAALSDASLRQPLDEHTGPRPPADPIQQQAAPPGDPFAIADKAMRQQSAANRSTANGATSQQTRDISNPALLRTEAPLAMPAQDFDERIPIDGASLTAVTLVPRVTVFAGTALLTLAFAYELYGVLSFVRLTPIQFVFWILSTVSFGWIALGSLSAAMGFLPLFAGDTADNISLPPLGKKPGVKTALLVPVYNEEPSRIAGTIDAMSEELEKLGAAANFDIFVLSDTRDAKAGATEERVYAALKSAIASRCGLYYRRRRFNTERKAGNIRDWIERFGAAYPHFLILDADSVMSGEALVRLTLAMEANPKAALIQTVPRLTGGTTLLQRLQQFACNVYGPAVASGIAVWHRDQGNYWGHNAMIRTAAFAGCAGLPTLPGAAPFGGHILSHDFVEAVLLQRAGWGVHMVPSLEGSYEGLPPGIVELVVRDRRWAQGNLQHLAILTAPGLTAMGRVHLTMGAFAYLVSAIWAASLAVGLVLLLQGQQLIPSYFQDSKTLFPVWPVIDPGSALRLFMATMGVVLLPKGLGLILELQRVYAARERGGSLRAIAAVATETVYSMLIAPILMMTQTSAVGQILMGRDAGWKPQSRDENGIPLTDAMRFHARHMIAGMILALLCWNTTPELAIWMAPVILGLLLSGFINWYTARPAGLVMRYLLSTPQDRAPAPTLLRTELLAADWSRRILADGSREAAGSVSHAA
jgi:membrane glycosyltransferase